MTAALERLREGWLEIVENGRRRGFGRPSAGLRATISVHDPVFWRRAARSLRIAESYASGAWDCDDLVSLVRIEAREMPRFDRLRAPFTPLRRAFSRVPRNTRASAPSAHRRALDLGDDLFRLFLDESMTYSCAVWDRPGMTLAEAQEAKLELACRKLELTPDDHLLEIGSGWGSMALHAAARPAAGS